ncbi:MULTISPECIES: type II toxin-antitoxin system PemK/MazF family toxin [Halomonadaceae]|uniref:type II toxin-antitoxin system PemK/MazF family toxin n=1 Tax=Halomonadaceae TaxID=28256 RepID=UPI001C267C77|nr:MULTISPECIES: type II toxin-antitoxin system PemK/MazF family toxin [Halomonas]
MRRGEIVIVSTRGDYEKPRPALIVQSDLFHEHPSATLAPITSGIRAELPLFRLDLAPSEFNGLQRPGQVMIDKLVSVPRAKLSTPHRAAG